MSHAAHDRRIAARFDGRLRLYESLRSQLWLGQRGRSLTDDERRERLKFYDEQIQHLRKMRDRHLARANTSTP